MRSTIQVIVLVALLGGACHCPRAYGQRNAFFAIPRDSNVFIDPMEGFGSELKAAFLKEGVLIDIVSDKSMADFEITGEIEPPTHSQERLWVSIRILNLKTKDIVWGYGVAGITDSQSAADSCAEQLKRKMHRKR